MPLKRKKCIINSFKCYQGLGIAVHLQQEEREVPLYLKGRNAPHSQHPQEKGGHHLCIKSGGR